jgi:hypothetical protein
MRLLRGSNGGELSLTEELLNNIPEYAILSHTWEAEEVYFQDIKDGSGKSKCGYSKIQFCSNQAKHDGLTYFWVDTCCIDKSSSAVLTEAINSMFRWYRQATKCYVYLADVSTEPTEPPWELAFRNSRWFTRGWTLQELLAPGSVEFFSREGDLLGNKTSLEQQIHTITNIPVEALRGNRLFDLPVSERLAWMERRETTREEDMAYALLGLFGVQMPLIYGEGRERALKRLMNEINESINSSPTPITDEAALDLHADKHNLRRPAPNHRRICTVSPRRFWLLVFAAVVIVAAAIGAGVGGGLAAQHPR